MGVKEVKEILASRYGITDIDEEVISSFLEAGMSDEEVADIIRESVSVDDSKELETSVSKEEKEKANVVSTTQTEVKAVEQPQPSISVSPDSSVKKVLQKETSKVSKDILERFMEQVPPKGFIKIFLWDEDNLSWVFVAKVPADILQNRDIHSFLKKKYAKYDGVNRFKLEVFDPMGNKLAENEVSVFNERGSSSNFPVVLDNVLEGGDMDMVNTIKDLFEKMEKEKERMYQQMMELQKQLAQKEIEQAQRTMELLKEQLELLETSYRSKIEEIRKISETEGSEAQALVSELSKRFEDQLKDLRNMVFNVITQVSSSLKEITKKGEGDTSTLLQIITPIIQSALASLNKKDDSFEKMIKMLEFFDRFKKQSEVKIDPIQQLKAITEIVRNLSDNKPIQDPSQQFQTLFTLIKEILPKKDSLSEMRQFIELMRMVMPEKKDTAEEIQKFVMIAEALGLKKEDKDKLLLEFIREMKESQERALESFMNQQKELLNKLSQNSSGETDRLNSIISMISAQQQQQMQQMQMQMQMMMEQFKNTIENLVKTQIQAQTQMSIHQNKDPLEQIIENMAKIEKLKQVLGTNSGSSSGGIFSKIIEGISNILPTIIQAQAMNPQPNIAQAPAVGYSGMGATPLKVVSPRRKVVRRVVPRRRVVRTQPLAQKPPAPVSLRQKGGQGGHQLQAPQQASQQSSQQSPQAQPQAQQQMDLEQMKQMINVFDKTNVPADVLENFRSQKGELADRLASIIKGVRNLNSKSVEDIFAEVKNTFKSHNIDEAGFVSPFILAFDNQEEFEGYMQERLKAVIPAEKVKKFIELMVDLAKEVVIQQMMSQQSNG